MKEYCNILENILLFADRNLKECFVGIKNVLLSKCSSWSLGLKRLIFFGSPQLKISTLQPLPQAAAALCVSPLTPEI